MVSTKVKANGCSMLKWLTCPYRRPLRFRRSLISLVILFILTTGLLYVLVEHYTLTTNPIDFSSSSTDSKTLSQQVVCVINNETVRAIQLARSDYCKSKLKNISCQIDATPNFYPQSLPRFCPLRKGNFGDVIGCISFTHNSTTLLETFQSDMLCIDHCLKHSLGFADYNQLTGECRCLSTFDPPARSIIAQRKCSEITLSNDGKFDKNFSTIYGTGHMDFGNHLDKRRRDQTGNQTTIVFYLTVGGRRNLRQIQRLLRAIYSREHYYLIHVDSREDYLYEELSLLSKRFTNIHLAKKRYPTTWGSSMLLDAHLQAFKEIFEEFRWNFSFVLNLSESDFPLKPIGVLTNFLSKYTAYNFLRSHNREPLKFIKSQGMFQTFIHCDDYMYRLGPRPLIQNIIYDGGSDWYVLNREFVYYVTYGNDELVNGLRHVFNYSLLPCEAFFHTVLSNSIYCDTYVRNNLRLVHWNRDRGCKCQHKNVVDWCGCSPIVYRSVDQSVLNETIDKPLFFARKFDSTIDENILDWLDEKISRRDLSHGALYLENIYHLSTDQNKLDKRLTLLDSYARTRLVEYQEYRRHCFRDDTLQLEEIHGIFHASIFQGYSLRYQFSDGEQFELFLKLNSLGAIRSNQVKRFEVGVELDNKEILFLDRSRTFIEPKLVKVLIEWENATDNNTLLLINSPNGAILQRVKLLSSTEPLILDIFFPVISSPSMIGIWQMTIIEANNETLLASLNFLVLLPNADQSLDIQYLTILTHFWSISNTCSSKINSSLCRDLSNQPIPSKNDCFQQPWSSFYYDIKSNW